VLTIISKQEAIARGLASYFSGYLCQHSHISERRVRNGECIQCSRERALRWQRENPDKAVARNKRSNARRPDQIAQYQAEYLKRPGNLEKKRARYRRWRAANGDAAREATQRWYQENLEDARVRKRKWSKENPDGARAANRRRRARKKNAEGSHTVAEIRQLLEDQGGICAAPDCEIDIRETYTVDHKTPLSRDGTDYISNIQLLCLSCNSSKSNRTMDEWGVSRVRK
jgi:hypothetical protein